MKKFMTLPYKREFKNCILHNAIHALHYTQINKFNKQEFVYIMKPSTMLAKGRKRVFKNIKRGIAVASILKECRNNEPVFIVKFKNIEESRNLSSEYAKRYPGKEFEMGLFMQLLKEI